MGTNKGIYFLLIVLMLSGIHGARILAYFPTPSISHQLVFRPLTQALAARGHEVIVVTTDPVFPKGQTPANLTEIDVHDISYEIWGSLYKYHRGNKRELLVQVKAFFEVFTNVFYRQAQTTEVKELLNKDRKYFDLLLLEACNRGLMGFSHIYDAPVITISSFGAVPAQYHTMGAPVHPILYPTAGRQRLYKLSLLEKCIEMLGYYLFDFLVSDSNAYEHKIMKSIFGEDVPTFPELKNNVELLFLNEHPIWADNHPVPPSIQYIGGIHETKYKDLPADLKKYLDSSKNGVIYVSFGTNVLPSLLPPEKIEIMAKVLSQLPYDILWKYDKDVLPIQSKNINISKWFPQPDLLRHPKIKLFITQGGLQSTDEAINSEVPMLGIPMLIDQWYNVEKYVHHNIGLQLDIMTLTEEEFKQSIEKIINDESYKKNITRLKTLMREHPLKPLDNAVWWTEHIIKYGGNHLKSPAADMSWTEYYEVELVLILFAILITILTVLGWIMKSVLKFMYNIYRTNIKLKIY
ncbi:UDP-glucosyltransferase 2-like [Bicyclus anynana]|uniref:UDP-glucuronosyltransferase n=1 Tax=Bicyclus anynana TaxID=110368 RepID=A0ABM3LPP6_BICAN|nr:UDP-glucosyltransferase 2-like [Bicyclus anynana]